MRATATLLVEPSFCTILQDRSRVPAREASRSPPMAGSYSRFSTSCKRA